MLNIRSIHTASSILISALVLVSPLSIYTTAWWHHALFLTSTQTVEYTYTVPKSSSLTLHALNGLIKLSPGSSENSVNIKAIKKGTKEELPLTTLESNLTGDMLTLKTQQKESADFPSPITVDYIIEIPKNINKIVIEAKNGPINIENIDSTFDIKLECGDITIKNARKNSTLNIYQRGNISLTQKSLLPHNALFLETMQGSITLIVPSKINAQLNARTLNGRLTCDIPIILDSRKTKLNKDFWLRVKREAQGTLGIGGATILVETTRGNIMIKGQDL
jgi:hypothetical protein